MILHEYNLVTSNNNEFIMNLFLDMNRKTTIHNIKTCIL